MSRFTAYRTPLVLLGVFIVLLAVFAATPDADLQGAIADSTAEPTSGPSECVVCQIDQECDGGQCRFIDHTPWPCVPSAKFDDEAGQCLPEGAPPPPAVAATTEPGRIPGPVFPGGIGDNNSPRGPDLPAIGD